MIYVYHRDKSPVTDSIIVRTEVANASHFFNDRAIVTHSSCDNYARSRKIEKGKDTSYYSKSYIYYMTEKLDEATELFK